MKKIVAMAALAALVSSSAFAVGTIADTKHNLRFAKSGLQNYYSTNLDEICSFCHTPHASNTSVTAFAPLWNRTATDGASLVKYTSSTAETATKNATGLAGSDAVLCLSCHDGASMGGGLTNNPNVLTGAVAVNAQISGAANLGTDLSNDHPVGFDYSAVNTADSNVKDVAGVASASNNKVKFFTSGANTNQMWCSSCHDVHDNTNKPFLVMDNAGSALCLACHNK